eukprot:gene21061-23117_t
MAGTREIEDLVHGIINHPEFRQCLHAAVGGSSDTTSGNRNAPVGSSIINNNNNGNNELRPQLGPLQTQARHGDAQEELSSIFRRGGSSSQLRNPPRFARGVNHHRPRPAPYRRSQPLASTTSRNATGSLHSNNSSKVRAAEKQRFIVKEVVLIPDPDETTIIRGSRRAALMERGYVRNDVEIDKGWSEDTLMDFLVGLFKDKLVNDANHVPGKSRLKVLLGIGSSIQEPWLQAGQTLNGACVSRLFAQKIMWLKPHDKHILVEALDEEVIDLKEQESETHHLKTHLEDDFPPAFGDTAKPSTSKEMSFVEKVEKLSEMVNSNFSKEDIVKALMDNHEDIELAGNKLLLVNLEKKLAVALLLW